MDNETNLSLSLSEQPILEMLTEGAGAFPTHIPSYQNVNIEINPNPVIVTNPQEISKEFITDVSTYQNDESQSFNQSSHTIQTHENQKKQEEIMALTYLFEEHELKSRLYEIVNQVLSTVADSSYIEMIVNSMINKGKYGVTYPVGIENIIQVVYGEMNRYLANKQ